MVKQFHLGEIIIKQILLRITKLFIGLFLYAVGIVLTINANIGLAPWDIFHQGISRLTGITMGQASIGMGIIIIISNGIFKEKLGWGTLGNMIFIGLFMDVLMINELIPVSSTLITGVIMMALGMLIVGFASYLYIDSALGSGPRDGLMIMLTKRTGKSVRFIRNSIEVSASVMGYMLGGSIGIGTVIMAFTLGYFIQFVFKLMKFEINTVEHRFIDDDIKYIKNFIKKREKNNIDCDEDMSI
jgi:uncharacterized membrane protein YczE